MRIRVCIIRVVACILVCTLSMMQVAYANTHERYTLSPPQATTSEDLYDIGEVQLEEEQDAGKDTEQEQSEENPTDESLEPVSSESVDDEADIKEEISLKERLRPYLVSSFVILPVVAMITVAIGFIFPHSIAMVVGGIAVLILMGIYAVADSIYKYQEYRHGKFVSMGYAFVNKMFETRFLVFSVWGGVFGSAVWKFIDSSKEVMQPDLHFDVSPLQYIFVVIGGFSFIMLIAAGIAGIIVAFMKEILVMIGEMFVPDRSVRMPQQSTSFKKLTSRQQFYIANFAAPAIEEVFYRFVLINVFIHIAIMLFGISMPIAMPIAVLISAYYFWASHKPFHQFRHFMSGIGYGAVYVLASLVMGPVAALLITLSGHFMFNYLFMSPPDTIVGRDTDLSDEMEQELVEQSEVMIEEHELDVTLQAERNYEELLEIVQNDDEDALTKTIGEYLLTLSVDERELLEEWVREQAPHMYGILMKAHHMVQESNDGEGSDEVSTFQGINTEESLIDNEGRKILISA
ncbi:MAG: hypothetical protein JW938_06530 [Candidatus Omnitrophica bacterium]|nr:hypothetical protein [Candidatus Omnitrophota bacterium]